MTTPDGVLLGRLRGTTHDAAAADTDLATPVVEVMEAGPSTLRPHESAAEVRSRFDEKGLSYAIVTDPDGRLLGTVSIDLA